MRRVRDHVVPVHVVPFEDARLREQMGVGTKLAKLLLVYSEAMPGRMLGGAPGRNRTCYLMLRRHAHLPKWLF